MSGLISVPVLGGFAATMAAVVLLLFFKLQKEEKVTARIADVRRAAGLEAARVSNADGGLMQLVSGLGLAIARSGALSASTLESLGTTLSSAGFRGQNPMALFVGAKVLLVLSLPLVAFIATSVSMAGSPLRIPLIAGAAIAGLLLPDTVVRKLRDRYLMAVEKALPDTLDMMVTCSEAGLSLESALERVGQEIGMAHQAMADELNVTVSEMRVLSDRRTALTAMGERTGIDSLKRLASTLIQTLQYGTPLTQALRTLSAEMRHEQLMKFEARAARLPVLLTVPMILFILPTVFLVIGGPAVLQLLRAM